MSSLPHQTTLCEHSQPAWPGLNQTEAEEIETAVEIYGADFVERVLREVTASGRLDAYRPVLLRMMKLRAQQRTLRSA